MIVRPLVTIVCSLFQYYIFWELIIKYSFLLTSYKSPDTQYKTGGSYYASLSALLHVVLLDLCLWLMSYHSGLNHKHTVQYHHRHIMEHRQKYIMQYRIHVSIVNIPPFIHRTVSWWLLLTLYIRRYYSQITFWSIWFNDIVSMKQVWR